MKNLTYKKIQNMPLNPPDESTIKRIFELLRKDSDISDEHIFFIQEAISQKIKHDKDIACKHPFDKVESTGTNHFCKECNTKL